MLKDFNLALIVVIFVICNERPDQQWVIPFITVITGHISETWIGGHSFMCIIIWGIETRSMYVQYVQNVQCIQPNIPARTTFIAIYEISLFYSISRKLTLRIAKIEGIAYIYIYIWTYERTSYLWTYMDPVSTAPNYWLIWDNGFIFTQDVLSVIKLKLKQLVEAMWNFDTFLGLV